MSNSDNKMNKEIGKLREEMSEEFLELKAEEILSPRGVMKKIIESNPNSVDNKEITALEHLKAFIEYLRSSKPLMEDAKKFLTVTNQEECKYVGRQSVEGAINGLYGVLQTCLVTSITESPAQPSPLVRDCKIKLSNIQQVLEIGCRLVKESGVRHPDPNGNWGVNAASFKYIK